MSDSGASARLRESGAVWTRTRDLSSAVGALDWVHEPHEPHERADNDGSGIQLDPFAWFVWFVDNISCGADALRRQGWQNGPSRGAAWLGLVGNGA
jgi:hypothetical protein